MSKFEITPLDKQKHTNISTVPQHPFTCYITGAKCSGKSTLILNLLLKEEFLNGKFNKVYFVSKTCKLDAKLNVLKEKDITIPNYKLIKLLRSLKKKKQIMSSIDDIPEDLTRNMDEDDFIEDITPEFLEQIIQEQKYIIKNFGKQFADRILIVLDDSISDKTLNTSFFKNMVFNSRHLNISMIIVSQSYYCLQKSVRNNNSHLILYETGNISELKDIYSENAGKHSFNTFLKMYRECVDEPFGFIVINYQNPMKYRFQNQFKQFLQIE
jgi:hypothetical protein